MIAAFLCYTFLALCLFYLQNLVYFPQVHLRLLCLLLFYVGLRPSLALPLALALTLGALQDSFAITWARPCCWWPRPASSAGGCSGSGSAPRWWPVWRAWLCKRPSC